MKESYGIFRYFKRQQSEINFFGYACMDNKYIKLCSDGSKQDFKEIYLKHSNRTHLTLYLIVKDWNQVFLNKDKYLGLLPNITHLSFSPQQIRNLSQEQLKVFASIFPNIMNVSFLDKKVGEINPVFYVKIQQLFNIGEIEVPSLKAQCAFFINKNRISDGLISEDLQEIIAEFKAP